MIEIVNSKADVKRYLNAVCALFDLYALKGKRAEGPGSLKALKKVIETVHSGKMYDSEPAKKELFIHHLLKGESIEKVSERINFSKSYTYALRQEILKEIAMMVFEVIIV